MDRGHKSVLVAVIDCERFWVLLVNLWLLEPRRVIDDGIASSPLAQRREVPSANYVMSSAGVLQLTEHLVPVRHSAP
jgi:hypothetical protein